LPNYRSEEVVPAVEKSLHIIIGAPAVHELLPLGSDIGGRLIHSGFLGLDTKQGMRIVIGRGQEDLAQL
jgi:hypothetical protein